MSKSELRQYVWPIRLLDIWVVEKPFDFMYFMLDGDAVWDGLRDVFPSLADAKAECNRRNGIVAVTAPLLPSPSPTPAPSTGNPVLDVLLSKFPSFDPNWTEQRQEWWFATYTKLLQMKGSGSHGT